jgi:hypothetical protein
MVILMYESIYIYCHVLPIEYLQTNSMDDEGLLEGKWASEYPKGSVKPWEWTGSVAIIEKYHETGKPVQYGQCWVFSGVFTTCEHT